MSIPWYKDRKVSPPFTLSKRIHSTSLGSPAFRSIAFFPWTNDSLQTLWNGNQFDTPGLLPQWKAMVSEFSDAVVVGGLRKVYLFFTDRARNPTTVSLPEEDTDIKSLPTDVINVAWTLDPAAPLEPLIIFSHINLLYIYNVKKKAIASYLRGHGGAITSIVVHPITTNLFCTTSRDYSTRIYDLSLPPQSGPGNPPWPPGKVGSRAGAAHGLYMTEPEGSGKGRCIIILMGGRSGGHQAAVLGAAFHRELPLIATCGLDRLVKIWFVPRASQVTLTREDKPLFSSSKIHRARVLSISWLHHDLLLTHCAPALMRKNPDDPTSKQTYVEPGNLVIWRWLAINRFFRDGDTRPRQDVLRGCASDYQESGSFKIISQLPLPGDHMQGTVPILHVYQSASRDPLILFTPPHSTSISMINPIHLEPRKPPPFPLGPVPIGSVDFLHSNGLGADGLKSQEKQMDWVIHIPNTLSISNKPETIMASAMGREGKTIIAVGTGGSIWIWNELATNPPMTA